MAVTQAWPIQRWIEKVNRLVVVRKDENYVPRMKRQSEKPGPYGSFYEGVVISRDPSVDLVIQGPCSVEPMPNLNWLRDIFAEYPKAYQVALYASCCGGEFSNHQELIRRTFRNITFTFLNVPNLYDTPDDHCDDIVRAAIEARIVGICKLE